MKILRLILLLFVFTLVIGCNSNNTITCTLDIKNEVQNYQNTGNYKIYYKGNYVTKIVKNEEYASSDKSVLNYFYEVKELEYYDLSDKYSGVTYEIKKNEGSIKIKATIDLNTFDIKSMVRDGKIDKDYVISNKLTTSGIKRVYESIGATCK